MVEPGSFFQGVRRFPLALAPSPGGGEGNYGNILRYSPREGRRSERGPEKNKTLSVQGGLNGRAKTARKKAEKERGA